MRGTWPISFTSSDPSGVCSTSAQVNGQQVDSNVDYWVDQSNFQQCPDLGLSHELDTTAYQDGPIALSLIAGNAAGVETQVDENINVDNQPVTLNLSGPSDAPSTAGPQIHHRVGDGRTEWRNFDRLLT